jgi:hypothetical protein
MFVCPLPKKSVVTFPILWHDFIFFSIFPWSVQKLWQALLTAAQCDFYRGTTMNIGGLTYSPAGPAAAGNSMLSKGIAPNAFIEAISLLAST